MISHENHPCSPFPMLDRNPATLAGYRHRATERAKLRAELDALRAEIPPTGPQDVIAAVHAMARTPERPAPDPGPPANRPPPRPSDPSALLAFVEDRLQDVADDANAASRERGGTWRAEPEEDLPTAVRAPDGPIARVWAPAGEHVARHDPATVLADVTARRVIIGQVFAHRAEIDGEWGCSCSADAIRAGNCPENPAEVVDQDLTLRALALPFGDHPEHSPAWAVG